MGVSTTTLLLWRNWRYLDLLKLCVSCVPKFIKETWPKGTIVCPSERSMIQVFYMAYLLKCDHILGDSSRDLFFPERWRSRLQPWNGQVNSPSQEGHVCRIARSSFFVQTFENISGWDSRSTTQDLLEEDVLFYRPGVEQEALVHRVFLVVTFCYLEDGLPVRSSS